MIIALDEDFDPDSPTLAGPFPMVGDCVCEQELRALAFTDELPIRVGDLGIWQVPNPDPAEQYACKRLVADGADILWLACKYFAVKYRPDFHKAVARVVAILSDTPGTLDPELSARLHKEMQTLRQQPPVRDDVVVFPVDLLTHEAIVAAINGRHQLH